MTVKKFIKNNFTSANFAICMGIFGFLGSLCWFAIAWWILHMEQGYYIQPVLSILSYIYVILAVLTKNIQKFGNAMGFLILNVMYGIAAIFTVPYVPQVWKPTVENYYGLIIMAIAGVYSFLTMLVVWFPMKTLEDKLEKDKQAVQKLMEAPEEDDEMDEEEESLKSSV